MACCTILILGAALVIIFTHGFSIDFKDQNDYDAFLNDPLTHPAKDGIVSIAEDGYNGIVGFDFI